MGDYYQGSGVSAIHSFQAITTMKTKVLSLSIIPVALLTLTQCDVQMEASGSIPPGSNNPSMSAPASDYVPAKVKADCMAKLSGMVGGKPMKVVSAVKGENSYIVDIQVEGVPNLWRCYHDGTQCTGTEYQGEG